MTTASDGEEALSKLQRDQPDVVLLDMVMPGPDGLETLRRIRETRLRIRETWCIDAKLSGCGTHMEHIGSVHDLFRASDAWNWKPLTFPNPGVSQSNDIKLGDWSRCSRANNMNSCDSSANA